MWDFQQLSCSSETVKFRALAQGVCTLDQNHTR